MYQKIFRNKNGLGFITEALSLFDAVSGNKPGATGMTSQPVTVSPQISTQISPQISPVFQQQFQPQNSAATAGTAQSLPGMSIPGMLPAPGYSSAPAVPAVPQVRPDWTKYAPYALAGLGILAFVGMKKRSVKKGT